MWTATECCSFRHREDAQRSYELYFSYIYAAKYCEDQIFLEEVELAVGTPVVLVDTFVLSVIQNL